MNEVDLQKFNQAIQLAQSGQIAAAQNILADLIPRYSRDANVWLWVAFTSTDRERARRSLERVAKLDPTNPNLAQATAWIEQQFPVSEEKEIVQAQTAQNSKSRQAAATVLEPVAAKSASPKRPKHFVRAFVFVLVFAIGATALLLTFVPEVRGFVVRSSPALSNIFNNGLPVPGADLVTPLQVKEEAVREFQATTAAPNTTPNGTKINMSNFGVFSIKTQNTSKILTYYAEKYPLRTAEFTSYNTPAGAFLYQELPDSKEHLMVFIIHNDPNNQQIQNAMLGKYGISLQTDESLMLVLLSKESPDNPKPKK